MAPQFLLFLLKVSGCSKQEKDDEEKKERKKNCDRMIEKSSVLKKRKQKKKQTKNKIIISCRLKNLNLKKKIQDDLHSGPAIQGIILKAIYLQVAS